MNEMKAIMAFLKSANIKVVHEGTGVSRPTLYKIKKGDVGNVQYKCLKKVSDFMDAIYEAE